MEEKTFLFIYALIIIVVYCWFYEKLSNMKTEKFISVNPYHEYPYYSYYPYTPCMETLFSGLQCFNPVVWPFYYW